MAAGDYVVDGKGARDISGTGVGPFIPKVTLVDASGVATSSGGGGDASASNQTSQITQETAINTVLGTTAGAAVITDVNGTVQQYLRGLVKLWIGGLAAGAAIIGKVGIDQTTPGTTNLVAAGVADGADVTQGAKADTLYTGGVGSWSIVALLKGLYAALIAATPAGTNLMGRSVADASAATGGIATTARLASAAASTNATRVSASAGRIYQANGKNNAAYDVFLVLYDSAANPPVPGTTTIRKKIVCPAGQSFVYDWPLGLSFATGIGYAFTKLVADADTTVLVAADITAFNLDYV